MLTLWFAERLLAYGIAIAPLYIGADGESVVYLGATTPSAKYLGAKSLF